MICERGSQMRKFQVSMHPVLYTDVATDSEVIHHSASCTNILQLLDDRRRD